MKSRFLIAAPSSNSGKTTITLGLLRLLHNRGIHVQPFKCGPDYIDTKHHSLAAAANSINLDTFMMSAAHVQDLYARYSGDADIIEGVMGLFDGADRMKGSSAEIAILLELPVILVINAKAMAYSVAPLLYGFKNFHPGVNIAGVIFNFVNTSSHYQFLKEACEDVGLTALGYVPVNDSLKIPSRHLGLVLPAENDYDAIAEHISKTVDVDKLLEITAIQHTVAKPTVISQTGTLRIAVAKDEAFNFTYYENIEVLKRMGTVTFFSPIHDTTLPEADLIYLAGGYPELHLQALASNINMKNAMLDYCNKGGKVLAECGGMMYLGQAIDHHEMVGFLDIKTSMENAKLSLGYRIVDDVLKGHEFHYSTCTALSDIPQTGSICNAKGIKVDTPVYRQNNVLASYIHFYWGDDQSKNALEALLSM
jgi:cobyrinic acid a,c-diamide synthase